MLDRVPQVLLELLETEPCRIDRAAQKSGIFWRRSCAARGERASNAMLGFQDFACALTDDHARRHGVARRDAWEDGSVRNRQTIDAVYMKTVIHNCRRVAAHLRRAALMPLRHDRIADEVLPLLDAV